MTQRGFKFCKKVFAKNSSWLLLVFTEWSKVTEVYFSTWKSYSLKWSYLNEYTIRVQVYVILTLLNRHCCAYKKGDTEGFVFCVRLHKKWRDLSSSQEWLISTFRFLTNTQVKGRQTTAQGKIRAQLVLVQPMS